MNILQAMFKNGADVLSSQQSLEYVNKQVDSFESKHLSRLIKF